MNNDWAFIAGFFDADGTVSKRTKGNRWHMGITNKNKKLLKWIQKRAGGNICTQGKWRGVYQLYWRKDEKIPVLTSILPFLIIKRDKALECLWALS